MRIRSIRPEFFKHEHVADLLPLTRLLFIALWCMADRRGRLEDRPRRIKVECLPFDECDVDAMLWELAESWFIERYELDGIQIIQVLAFEKHQRINGTESATESELPEREEGSTREAPWKHSGSTKDFEMQTSLPRPRSSVPNPFHEEEGDFLSNPPQSPMNADGSTLEALRKHLGSREGNGIREGKGREGKGREKVPRASFTPPTLAEWQAYCAATWSDWHPSRSQEGHEYYAKVEWKIGKARKPATDWKACASTAHKNAKEWERLQPKPEPPTREEYFAFSAQMAERCIPFPEEPRFQWGPDRWAESYNRHDARKWQGIADWKAILKADCQQWVAREQENRKRPAR